MAEVYIITNLVNHKIYVGMTSLTAQERWEGHLYSSRKENNHFHNAIKKYDKFAFETHVLAQVPTIEEAKRLENLWIVLLGSHRRKIGYNSTLGGESGETPNEETRLRIAQTKLGTKASEETREKMRTAHAGERNGFFGKTHDPQTIEAMRKKCSEANSGAGNYWFGKKLSAEHCANLSKARRGKKQKQRVQEHCEKISNAATARWRRWREERGIPADVPVNPAYRRPSQVSTMSS